MNWEKILPIRFHYQHLHLIWYSSYVFLLQQLHEKLGFHEDQHNYHQLSPLRETTSTSGSSINTMASANQHHPRGGHHGDLDSSIHHHSSTIDDGDGIDPKSLNSDTIILVCSLVVMILLGKYTKCTLFCYLCRVDFWNYVIKSKLSFLSNNKQIQMAK